MTATYSNLNINERINLKNQFAACVDQGFYHCECVRSSGVLHRAISTITSNKRLWDNYFRVN